MWSFKTGGIMTIELHSPKKSTGSPGNPAEPALKNMATCSSCQSRVILFSRTFQTYCYRCGLPVTQLDAQGLYYDVVEAAD